jgi:hypothetical protein
MQGFIWLTVFVNAAQIALLTILAIWGAYQTFMGLIS